ncbi:hypothetical protein P153DRAFT_227279 [Dothidotthia symphoricarpi CBS 119687]|uniref:Uncharacterized protein n=1 Tax=Dothidotthia symphoricarpi CBS 119687 TaxID=1392245 RepID=A0A6A6ADF0_9PLEO|nr:uncharacterized protein P153DRAFT_227279 [Dothidotthia symphoricarpi CBS 119687]KAF2129922.1 hypothetical protein P153DRAFT_227279 [Dothidotthia symphoricarpi CBS 119687]
MTRSIQPGLRRRDSVMSARDVAQSQGTIVDGNTRDALDLKVLGVCSGSGLTKLSLALVRYRRRAHDAPLRIELLQYTEIAVAPKIRARILNLLREAQYKPLVAASTNAALGQLFASGIKTFCQSLRIPHTSIDLVGTHTPTLRRFHISQTSNASNHPLGWNAVITAETGITAVFDFSVMDRAVQEHQVTSVAYIDSLLLRDPTKFRACLDINELATLSFIPASSDNTSHAPISRYCGPGSLLIDYAMRYCTSNNQVEDHDGKFAADGTVNQTIVDRFIHTYDYLRTAPPMHIATEMFGDHEAQRLIDECISLRMSEADTLATITRITAQNVLMRYRKLLHTFFPQDQKVDELFICGAGARNSNIIDFLEAELPESVITKPLDDIGIPGDANEAVCYAHLALEAILGQVALPTTPTTATATATATARQANKDIVRGRFVRGIKWDGLVEQVVQFSGGRPIPVAKDINVTGNLETAVRRLEL